MFFLHQAVNKLLTFILNQQNLSGILTFESTSRGELRPQRSQCAWNHQTNAIKMKYFSNYNFEWHLNYS